MADQSSPISVATQGIFTQVTAGLNSGYGLREDGRVFAWGDNSQGQLGDNSITQRNTPVLVVGFHVFDYIAAGWNHLLAIREDGSLWAWGRGTEGQLGTDSTPISASSPVSVVGGHEFVKVDAGECHSIGLKTDGSIWTWGCNDANQLGGYELEFFGAIGGGSTGFGGALDNNSGTLWMWGRNTDGQLGDNSTTDKSFPVTVAGPQEWGIIPTAKELGVSPCLVPGNCGGLGQFGDNVTWAMRTDGSMWMWGNNLNGQLGIGTFVNADYSSPMSVLGSGVSYKFWTASAPNGETYALDLNADLWVWGYTGHVLGGSLFGPPHSTSSPVRVEDYIFAANPSAPFVGGSWRWLSSGADGGMVGNGNEIFVWGGNNGGGVGCKLCLGYCSNPGSPVQIPTGNWVHGALGENNSMLIDPFGNVYGCGYNTQLAAMSPPYFGGGGPVARSTPRIVLGSPHSAIKVACAQNDQTFGFLREDGSMWMWGDNSNGECGVGFGGGGPSSVTSPTSVIGSGQSYSFVDFVIHGESGTTAIDNTGQVWSWGAFLDCGAGNVPGGFTNVPIRTSLSQIAPEQFRASPTQVPTDNPLFTDIAAGDNHNLAISDENQIWAWGDNTSGQLGLGDTTNRSTPTLVSGLPDIIDIAAGTQYSYALDENEGVWAWGDNTCGKLGDGSIIDKSIPVSLPVF